MSYALVVGGTIEAESGALPDSARRLDTDEWILGLADASVDDQHACGWYEVVETARPDDTDTTTTDRTLELVDGVPTIVWVERPKTQGEIDGDTAQENHTAIVENLEQDMVDMDAILAMTNATINGNPASVIKEICRMNRRLGRTALNDYTGSE